MDLYSFADVYLSQPVAQRLPTSSGRTVYFVLRWDFYDLLVIRCKLRISSSKVEIIVTI